MHPEPVDHVIVGMSVLAFALVLEGRATYLNVKELDKRRGTIPFASYLKQTKDADLVVVFGENSAATLGLLLALISLVIGWLTGNGVWDGIGSLMVGIVLIGVAIFLAVEVKGLLVGESAEPTIEKGVNEVIGADPNFEGLLRILTVQQGPGEVMVAMKVKLARGLTGEQTCAAINGFERALEAKHPEIKWCFVEPDVEK
jgi:divalent metal cation (Fe/Co/Zn/Cd) transporter